VQNATLTTVLVGDARNSGRFASNFLENCVFGKSFPDFGSDDQRLGGEFLRS
jgi:hypothetical protein